MIKKALLVVVLAIAVWLLVLWMRPSRCAVISFNLTDTITHVYNTRMPTSNSRESRDFSEFGAEQIRYRISNGLLSVHVGGKTFIVPASRLNYIEQ